MTCLKNKKRHNKELQKDSWANREHDGVMNQFIPAVKGKRWNCIILGLKFVYLNWLTKKYIMSPYGNCTTSNQTYITA